MHSFLKMQLFYKFPYRAFMFNQLFLTVRNHKFHWKKFRHFKCVMKSCRLSFSSIGACAPYALAFTMFSQTAPVEENLALTAQKLYDEGKHHEVYDLLISHKDCGDPAVLWRLCRACSDIGNTLSNGDEKKTKVYEGYHHIKSVLSCEHGACKENDISVVGKDHWAVHKWMAIMLGKIGDYEGIRAKMNYASQIRYHLDRAIELNPEDATTLHVLGVWFFSIADLAWYERKLISTLATPVSGSYAEALSCFERAEVIEPDFYLQNLLCIAECHIKMGKPQLAMPILKKLLMAVPKNVEDETTLANTRKLMETASIVV